MASGLVSSAIWPTQATRRWCFVGTVVSIVTGRLDLTCLFVSGGLPEVNKPGRWTHDRCSPKRERRVPTRQNDHPSSPRGYCVRWRFATTSCTFGLVELCQTRTNSGGIPLRHEDEALELRHQRAFLVQHAGVDLHRSAVRLGPRLAHLE